MKHYEFSILANQINDLKALADKKEKEGVQSEIAQILPVIRTIKDMLTTFYHVSRGFPMNLEDITDEAFLEELGRRLKTGDIKRDWDNHDENCQTIYIGDTYEKSIMRLELIDFTLEKGLWDYDKDRFKDKDKKDKN